MFNIKWLDTNDYDYKSITMLFPPQSVGILVEIAGGLNYT